MQIVKRLATRRCAVLIRSVLFSTSLILVLAGCASAPKGNPEDDFGKKVFDAAIQVSGEWKLNLNDKDYKYIGPYAPSIITVSSHESEDTSSSKWEDHKIMRLILQARGDGEVSECRLQVKTKIEKIEHDCLGGKGLADKCKAGT